MNKVQRQKRDLGMAPSTARDKLMRKIIFRHIEKEGTVCYRCGEPLELDTFSIEHIKPWRNEEDAIDIYFDLDNVTYSHKKCNSLHTRRNGCE